MPPALKEKDKVKTKFGEAEVVKPTTKGALVKLLGKRYSGIPIEVLHSEMTFESAPSDLSVSIIPPPVKDKISTASIDIDRQRALESLRFGLVPESYITELTLGYDDLEKWVLRRLPSPNTPAPKASEICGPFGSGKSHMMSVIRYIARKEGYMTANVEVDGRYISFSDPERLLNSLWGTLAGRDFNSCFPMLDLYLKAIDKGYSLRPMFGNSPNKVRDNLDVVRIMKEYDGLDRFGEYVDAVLSCSNETSATEINTMLRTDDNMRWHELILRRPVRISVAERPEDFVVTLAGNAIIARMAGYKGLVVTVDEFEVEHHNPDRSRLQRIDNLLRRLTAYLRDNYKGIPAAPLGLFIATVNMEGAKGDRMIDSMVEASGGEIYQLKQWNSNDFVELEKRLSKLYCEAYGIGMVKEASLVDDGGSMVIDDSIIRAHIKRYIGILDAMYGPPSAPVS